MRVKRRMNKSQSGIEKKSECRKLGGGGGGGERRRRMKEGMRIGRLKRRRRSLLQSGTEEIGCLPFPLPCTPPSLLSPPLSPFFHSPVSLSLSFHSSLHFPYLFFSPLPSSPPISSALSPSLHSLSLSHPSLFPLPSLLLFTPPSLPSLHSPPLSSLFY